MVVWADDSDASKAEGAAGAPLPPPPRKLPPIERPALAPEITPFDSITAVHYDCMKPGSRFVRFGHAYRASPLPTTHPMHEVQITEEPPSGLRCGSPAEAAIEPGFYVAEFAAEQVSGDQPGAFGRARLCRCIRWPAYGVDPAVRVIHDVSG